MVVLKLLPPFKTWSFGKKGMIFVGRISFSEAVLIYVGADKRAINWKSILYISCQSFEENLWGRKIVAAGFEESLYDWVTGRTESLCGREVAHLKKTVCNCTLRNKGSKIRPLFQTLKDSV